MVLKGLWLIGIDNAIAQATLGFHPNLQTPYIVSSIPELKPFADVIRRRVVTPKIMVEQGLDDFWVMFGLLQQRQDPPNSVLVSLHQPTQIRFSIRMNRQEWNDTQLGITRQVMVGENTFARKYHFLIANGSFSFSRLRREGQLPISATGGCGHVADLLTFVGQN